MPNASLLSTYPNATTEELDYYAIHEARLQFLLDEILSLQLSPKAHILDIGCFPPFLYYNLKDRGYWLAGVAAHHEQIIDSSVKICNIEIDRLPWKDESFELVLLTEVIEHLPHSPLFPLQEILRVLKPGGSLLLTTPNAVKLHNRLKLLVGKTVSFPIDQLLEVKPDDNSIYHLHNREYSLNELVVLLKAAGFQIEVARQVCLYPPGRKKSRRERLTSQIIKRAGYMAQQLHSSFKDSLYVRAAKPR